MTKASAAVITHEVYRRTSLLFWRHTTRSQGPANCLTDIVEAMLDGG
jgi:hypothetical protein